jgi:hypothetical protein
MGFNALADLAATCVRCGGMRQIRWFMLGCSIYACRLVGWATGAWRDWSVGSVVQVLHPTSCCGDAGVRRWKKALLEKDVTPWRAGCSFLRLSRVSRRIIFLLSGTAAGDRTVWAALHSCYC